MQLSTCLCIFGGANTHSIGTYRYTPYAREYSGLFLYISRISRSPCNYLHVFVYLAEQIDIVSVYAPYAREYSGLFLYISRSSRSPCNYLHVFVYLAEQIDIVSAYIGMHHMHVNTVDYCYIYLV